MYIDISIENEAWKTVLPDTELLVHRICKITLSSNIISEPLEDTAEISVVLADDAMIQDLNAQYRQKNVPTNVLSFPAMEMHEGKRQQDDKMPLQVLGDVILSLDTLICEANNQEKPLRDHFCHLLAHGILHLLGYDHITDDEAKRMEAKEIKILQQIGIRNPYLLEQNT